MLLQIFEKKGLSPSKKSWDSVILENIKKFCGNYDEKSYMISTKT